MALVNCSECSREVSDSAASCPGCGHPLLTPVENRVKPTKVVRSGGMYEGIGFILIVAGVFIGTAGNPGGAVFACGIGFIIFLIGRFK